MPNPSRHGNEGMRSSGEVGGVPALKARIGVLESRTREGSAEKGQR